MSDFDPAAEMQQADAWTGGLDTLLTTSQFSTDDIAAIVGITKKQLEHAIDPSRKIVRVSGSEKPRVQGKRRLFSGMDAISLVTVFSANAAGFPQRFTQQLVDLVKRRCIVKPSDPSIDLTPNLAVVTWKMREADDWAICHIHDRQSEIPKVPLAHIAIHVDRLIDETLQKLEAVVNEQPIPNFDVADPVASDPYSPEEDFFCMWDRENKGCLVGLSREETELYVTWRENRRAPDFEYEKWQELHSKHEGARFQEILKRRNESDAGVGS